MNTVKNFTTIYLRSSQIDVLEVVILFNELSNKVCVLNKTEDLNLSVFNMITEINESQILTKAISCKRKRRFNGRKCNSDQCECNNRHVCEKDYSLESFYLQL